MSIYRYIFSLLLLVSICSCSTFTTIRHTQSRETRSLFTGITSKNRKSIEPSATAQDSTLTRDSIAAISIAEADIQLDTLAHVEAEQSVDTVDIIEYVEIPKFTSEQSAHVMISEFKSQALFEDTMLSYEELSRNFCYPKKSYITSDYGWRGSRMHTGIDIKAYTRDSIYAAFDGVVRVAMYNGAYGNCIVIRHYNGLETLYAHSTKMLVKVNQEVKAGEVIALAGRTGRATGVHLHFEVRAVGQYIDPNLILDTKNHTLNGKDLYLMMRNGRIFGSNNESLEAREAEIKEIISLKYHTVKSGDTLSQIAVKYKTTVSKICTLNKISSRSIIKVGQRLRVQ